MNITFAAHNFQNTSSFFKGNIYTGKGITGHCPQKSMCLKSKVLTPSWNINFKITKAIY